MSRYYVIHNPTTGDIIYRGNKPKEPLTQKMQANLDGDYELVGVEGDLPDNDLAFVRLEGTKLVLRGKVEIDEIERGREAESKAKGMAELKAQLMELGVVVP
jgi:hypothetical protein